MSFCVLFIRISSTVDSACHGSNSVTLLPCSQVG